MDIQSDHERRTTSPRSGPVQWQTNLTYSWLAEDLPVWLRLLLLGKWDSKSSLQTASNPRLIKPVVRVFYLPHCKR